MAQQSFLDAVDKASRLSYKDKLRAVIADAPQQSRSSSKALAVSNLSADQQENSQAPRSPQQQKPSTPTARRASFTLGAPPARLVRSLSLAEPGGLQRSRSLAEPGGSPKPRESSASVSRPRAAMISRRRSTDGNFAGPSAPTPPRLGRGGLAAAGLVSLQSPPPSPPRHAGADGKKRQNSWTQLPGTSDGGPAGRGSHTSPRGLERLARARVARDMNIPVETVQEAQDLFHTYAGGAGRPTLTRESFLKLLCHLGNHAHTEDVPQPLVERAFTFCNLDRGCVDFRTFLTWFSTQSFREDVLLQGADLERRIVARGASSKFHMPLCEVEQHRLYFDQFDTNNNGVIDPEEFERVVRKCAKLPGHVDIPEARLKQLWADCDVNRNGRIDFEEFLCFYQKHFEAGGAGFEGYYRGIRAVPGRKDDVAN